MATNPKAIPVAVIMHASCALHLDWGQNGDRAFLPL
jgi:hypothetical protein